MTVRDKRTVKLLELRFWRLQSAAHDMEVFVYIDLANQYGKNNNRKLFVYLIIVTEPPSYGYSRTFHNHNLPHRYGTKKAKIIIYKIIVRL